MLQEYHGWNQATWAGIAQTSGDLVAAFMISLPKRPAVELENAKGLRWMWLASTGQPYNLSWLLPRSRKWKCQGIADGDSFGNMRVLDCVSRHFSPLQVLGLPSDFSEAMGCSETLKFPLTKG